jgi:Protein kinase domain
MNYAQTRRASHFRHPIKLFLLKTSNTDATMKEPYEFNAYCESCLMCNICEYPVAPHEPDGLLSTNDILRHEDNNDNHRETQTSVEDREEIVDDADDQAEALARRVDRDCETNEDELKEFLIEKYLVTPEEKFPSCKTCKKMMKYKNYRRDKYGHKHEFSRNDQDGNSIKGWNKKNPPVVRCSSGLDPYLAILSPLVTQHFAPPASDDDSDDDGVDPAIVYDPNKYFDPESFDPQAEWSHNDFECCKKLGVGGFGRVDLARENTTEGLLALKTVKSNVDDEIRIQRRLHHDNIVRLYDFFKYEYNGKTRTVLMVEYCDGGTLQDALDKIIKEDDGNFPEEYVVSVLLQIVEALIFCHSQDIMHCDIKPENILIGRDGKIKLADFGLSLFKMTNRPHNYRGRGTIFYMSPEILANYPFNEKTDIWSLGVLLYVLLTKEFPFYAKSGRRLFARIENDLGEEGTFEFPSSVSNGARDMILKMLLIDPNDRIALEEVKNHDWIQEVIQRPLYKSLYERSG